MTRNQAQKLMDDLSDNITEKDYIDDIYLSIKGVGTQVFRNCSYFEADEFTFIWTKNERFLISRKEIGDYVVIPYDLKIKVKLKKVV
jgi:hypothetical protein